MNVSGWKRKLIPCIRVGGSQFILINFKGKEWPWFKLLAHNSSKEKGDFFQNISFFFDPVLELKDESTPWQNGCQCGEGLLCRKWSYRRKRRRRERRTKRKSILSMVILKIKEIFPSCTNVKMWDCEKIRKVWKYLCPIPIFCFCISHFNEISGKFEFFFSLLQILWPPLLLPWVCTVNRTASPQGTQGRSSDPGAQAASTADSLCLFFSFLALLH